MQSPRLFQGPQRHIPKILRIAIRVLQVRVRGEDQQRFQLLWLSRTRSLSATSSYKTIEIQVLFPCPSKDDILSINLSLVERGANLRPEVGTSPRIGRLEIAS